MSNDRYEGCPEGLAVLRHPDDGRYAVVHDLTSLTIAGGFVGRASARRFARRLGFANWALAVEEISDPVRTAVLRSLQGSGAWTDEQMLERLQGLDPATRGISRELEAAGRPRVTDLSLGERLRLIDHRAENNFSAGY